MSLKGSKTHSIDKSYQAVGLMMIAIGKAINGAISYQDLSRKIVKGTKLLERLNDEFAPQTSNSGPFKERLVRNIVNNRRNSTQNRSPSYHDFSETIMETVMEVLEQLNDEPAPQTSNSGPFKERLVRNILSDIQREMRTTSPGSKSLSNLKAMVNLARKLSDDDDDNDDDDSRSSNLKYAVPKYNNIDSIVKHVGNGDEGEDGVKVTIMNFND